MKPFIRTFDSHEEADAFVLAERIAMTPKERIELCIQISAHGWQLHNPGKPIGSLRSSGKVEIRDRCSESAERPCG